MTVILCNETADGLLAGISRLTCDAGASDRVLLEHAFPTQREVDDARIRLGIPAGSERPIHLLVQRPSRNNRRRGARFHGTASNYGRGSFSYIGGGIYSTSPEHSLIRYAASHAFIDTVFFGCVLCGRYSKDAMGGSSLSEREPLTDKAKIAAFLIENRGLTGVNTVQQALSHIVEGARSPREILLYMRLCLPSKYGGFGLPHPILNKRIKLNRKTGILDCREMLEVDMMWPNSMVAVEYDSDAFHLDSLQHTRDAIKNEQLKKMGYAVHAITAPQMDDPDALLYFAKSIAAAEGKRLSLRAKGFRQAQRALFMMR